MGCKKFLWPVFFLLLGLISILAQTVILREVTGFFYGNELFYGLGLGGWLLFTGLGSLFAIKLKWFSKTGILWLILGKLIIFLPILVVVLRWLIANSVLPGELPSPGFSFLILGLILGTFCFPLGAEFALATLCWQKQRKQPIVSLAYFWETIGFALGGLFFSFILATSSFPLGLGLDRLTLNWRYPGLVKEANSNFQQIVVTQKDNQTNYFLGGQTAFTDKEGYESQRLLNLIVPFIDTPEKILVLGNPNLASGIKKEFPSGKIVFLEMDSRLLEFEEDLFPEGINLVAQDPRRFLSQNNQRWDLAIFSPGNPQTLLGNRLFTKESFEQIKDRLEEGGIFVLFLYLPTDYQSKEALLLGSSIYQTLAAVFPKIELLAPEDQLLFIASNKEIKINQAHIDSIWRDYFWHEVGNDQRKEIAERLNDTSVGLNTDFEPVAFFYQQLFWQTIFSFKTPMIIMKTTKFLFPFLLIPFLILFIKGKKKLRLGLSALSSSFVLISLEVLIILFFQTKIGYLYSQVSLIFAAVLLGIGLGVVLKFKLGFLGYLPILFIIFLISLGKGENLANFSGFWFLLALVSGMVGGRIFALINQSYLQTFKNTGFIYAFDLFGGSLGAIFTAGFFLPVLGLRGLIIGLAGVVLANIFTAKHRE